jgi:hypothetical protein
MKDKEEALVRKFTIKKGGTRDIPAESPDLRIPLHLRFSNAGSNENGTSNVLERNTKASA